MDSNGINSYTKLFLESANDVLDKIKSNLGSNPEIKEIHRLFHNLKGQSLFMNLKEIGELSFKGEKIMEKIINDKTDLDDTQQSILANLVEDISSLLKEI